MYFNQDNIDEFHRIAKAEFDENYDFLMHLKMKKSKSVDDAFLEQHDDVFIDTDCLKCANCCKTISPTFTETDIKRIAKYLKTRVSTVIDTYLRIDEDNDYVVKNTPCPFLGTDNYCSIYEARPRACREYPHTNRKNMAGIMRLTAMNTTVCPATYEIVKRLKSVKIK